MKVISGPKWGINYKINWNYGRNGLPIIYTNEFKWKIYIQIPAYEGDLC